MNGVVEALTPNSLLLYRGTSLHSTLSTSVLTGYTADVAGTFESLI